MSPNRSVPLWKLSTCELPDHSMPGMRSTNSTSDNRVQWRSCCSYPLTPDLRILLSETRDCGTCCFKVYTTTWQMTSISKVQLRWGWCFSCFFNKLFQESSWQLWGGVKCNLTRNSQDQEASFVPSLLRWSFAWWDCVWGLILIHKILFTPLDCGSD